MEVPGLPELTKDIYAQSEVDAIVSAYRNSITNRNGVEKMYTRQELRKILLAVAGNPKHRQ